MRWSCTQRARPQTPQAARTPGLRVEVRTRSPFQLNDEPRIRRRERASARVAARAAATDHVRLMLRSLSGTIEEHKPSIDRERDDRMWRCLRQGFRFRKGSCWTEPLREPWALNTAARRGGLCSNALVEDSTTPSARSVSGDARQNRAIATARATTTTAYDATSVRPPLHRRCGCRARQVRPALMCS